MILFKATEYGQVQMTAEEASALLFEQQINLEKEALAFESNRVAALWQAATDYEQSFIANMAIGLLTMGVMQGKPKCLAVSQWSYALWNGPDGYYARKASGSTDYDYSDIGPMPYSVPELSEEVYGS